MTSVTPEVELIERGDESLNYEQIQSLDPDVILNVRAAFDDQAYERLSEIAPTIQATEGTPDYAVNWRDHTRTIAQGLGKVEEGEAQVAELDEKIADIKDEHPNLMASNWSPAPNSVMPTVPACPVMPASTSTGISASYWTQRSPNSPARMASSRPCEWDRLKPWIVISPC